MHYFLYLCGLRYLILVLHSSHYNRAVIKCNFLKSHNICPLFTSSVLLNSDKNKEDISDILKSFHAVSKFTEAIP